MIATVYDEIRSKQANKLENYYFTSSGLRKGDSNSYNVNCAVNYAPVDSGKFGKMRETGKA